MLFRSGLDEGVGQTRPPPPPLGPSLPRVEDINEGADGGGRVETRGGATGALCMRVGGGEAMVGPFCRRRRLEGEGERPITCPLVR